jgi:hypothetical protein
MLFVRRDKWNLHDMIQTWSDSCTSAYNALEASFRLDLVLPSSKSQPLREDTSSTRNKREQETTEQKIKAEEPCTKADGPSHIDKHRSRREKEPKN